MTLYESIFGGNKQDRAGIKDIIDAFLSFFSIYGLFREYFLIGLSWGWKWSYFKFYVNRGRGMFNWLREFAFLMGFGVIATGVMLNWPLSIFILIGAGAMWVFFTIGFIERKLKLIDMESEIGVHKVSPPMRRIEENTLEGVNVSKEILAEIKLLQRPI